jgi:hypothetical protein
MSDVHAMNPWSIALRTVGEELKKASKEARAAYEFAPSSYTATAMAAEAYQRWEAMQQMCRNET